jgi:hypothetical protein
MKSTFIADASHNMSRKHMQTLHPWLEYVLPVRGGWKVFESESDYLSALDNV